MLKPYITFTNLTKCSQSPVTEISEMVKIRQLNYPMEIQWGQIRYHLKRRTRFNQNKSKFVEICTYDENWTRKTEKFRVIFRFKCHKPWLPSSPKIHK